jgi:hypothetical protein
MRSTVLAILIFEIFGAHAEVMAAQCSSYYISEINLVATDDTEAGHVQTFVGFGPSKEAAEGSALGSCSRVRFAIETCMGSDRMTGRNAPSDGDSNNSLHLKYMKAVRRITGCS